MSSDKYLKQIQKAAGDTPAVPDATQVYQSSPPPIPRKSISRKQYGAFKKTSVGLEIGDNPRIEDWNELGIDLMEQVKVINWWLGDYIAFGEDIGYGDVAKIAEEIGRDKGTLANYASVSRLVKLSLRHEDLEYSHHVAVAHADWTDEEKVYWLNQAAVGEWSVRRLREEIARAQLPAEVSDADNTMIAVDAPPLSDEIEEEATEETTHVTVKEVRKRFNHFVQCVSENRLQDMPRDDLYLLYKYFEEKFNEYKKLAK